MNTRVLAQTKPSTTWASPVRSNSSQRKCACGGTRGPSTINHQPSTASQVPPIVHEVLRSPGQAPGAETRAFTEPRFRHNFSLVHMHSNEKAAESAQVVSAAACTFSRPPSGTSYVAIQRMSATTAITVDGEELPQLSTPSGKGSSENVENPDLALADLEDGAPFKDTQEDSGPRRGDQSQQPNEEDRAVQTASDSNTMGVNCVSPSAVLAQLGSGEPLSPPLRRQMENGFGHDFTRVRVHSDIQADFLNNALGAHAFTVGEHIAFASDRYRPGTPDTQRLVAHELTHVIQQCRGLSGSILREGIGHPGDAYEREAEQMADGMSAEPSSVDRCPSRAPESLLADTSAVQLFSGSSAASYAKTWAIRTNPKYGRFPRDDCTNFVSQAMDAGGWIQIAGSNRCDLRKTDSVWWFKFGACFSWPKAFLMPLLGPVVGPVYSFPVIHASHTWAGAHNFFKFLKASGRGTLATTISDLEPGDVLQRDHGDGTMHHSMVVTEKGKDVVGGKSIPQLWLSYHTSDTLNRKFWGPGEILDETPPGWKYYPWKIT
jgi:Domain of unknown function (DUF4157)/Putative amidase domain